MKVQELREVLTKYNEDEKTKLIIELYKSIPKRLKEEKYIDNLILDINKPKEKKEKVTYTIDELVSLVDEFVLDAKRGFYQDRRNKNRSKWRFIASNYYKELNKYIPNTEEGIKATDALISLYKIINYGSKYLTFCNWDTFNAVKVDKVTFLELVMRRVMASGNTLENIEKCINMLNYDLDGFSFVMDSFSYGFDRVEDMQKSIDLIDEKINICKSKITKYQKDRNNNEYYTKKVNFYTEVNYRTYIHMGKIKEGIKYLKDKYIADKRIHKEMIILDVLYEHDLIEEWIEEYEKNKNVVEGVSYLESRYHEFKSEIEAQKNK